MFTEEIKQEHKNTQALPAHKCKSFTNAEEKSQIKSYLYTKDDQLRVNIFYS